MVKYRVLNGGHNIPNVDIERRCIRSLQNFINHYHKICNNWYLVGNSTNETKLVAEGGLNRENLIINIDIWNQINQYVG